MVDTAPAGAASDATVHSLDVVPAVWGRIANIVVDRGEGSWLITTGGDRYLDYSSGIGVTNTGHAHPRVAAAVAAQAMKLLHGQQNIVYHEPGLRLHHRLQGLLPGGPWGAFLSNSGAEAGEAAVKLARVATKRSVIVAFRGGFHGRTAQTMALTSAKNIYRGDFEPLPGSVYFADYPYCFRAPGSAHDPAACAVGCTACDGCTCDWEGRLEELFHTLVYPEHVAAFIVEPVLGEGGYIIPPAGFLPRLRQIADRHGILLIADEVQTGFGRTGRFFAVEHWGVEPDILTFAKGVASGLPLSGIIAKQEVLRHWRTSAHGGTYGGNVVSCAAANATIDVIQDEGLVENAVERGAQLLAGLRELQARHRTIGDVRGLGLMVALEFVKPDEGDGRLPNTEMTKRVVAEALRRRLIVLTAGSHVQVVRIIPPLVTTAEEIDLALGILAESLEAAGA